LGSKEDGTLLTSHELVAILLEEDSLATKGTRAGDLHDAVMQDRRPQQAMRTLGEGMAKDCWAKDGGKEGQGPSKGIAGVIEETVCLRYIYINLILKSEIIYSQ